MQGLNYKIYLLEPNGNYAELDTEGLDFSTTFSLTDIKDISQKKDTLSKNITFVGTKNNNRIFGNVFNQSRHVDPNIQESLFINFSVNKPVECLVLENSTPILKGYLKFSNAIIDGGIISYECIITGNIFNFYSLLGDKLLSDLDFTEYTHQFDVRHIIDSWDSNIKISGDTVAMEYGKGYLYPFINYGDVSSPYPSDVNKIHINNFRPAIYVKEYLNKIFNQPELSGFTYEVKGGTEFIEDFNRLIIPNNSDVMNQNMAGDTFLMMSNLFSIPVNKTSGDLQEQRRYLRFPYRVDYLSSIEGNSTPYPNEDGETGNVFTVVREFKTDGKVSFNYSATLNGNADFRIKLLERSSTTKEFTVVVENLFMSLNNNSQSKYVELIIPQRAFQVGKQFAIRFDFNGSVINLNSNITNLKFETGAVVNYNVKSGDSIAPAPVTNIKQKDFVKSLSMLLNLYTYSTLDNPKHIIFQTYNDYYSFCKPENIQATALDYTKKVDYSSKVTFHLMGNWQRNIHSLIKQILIISTVFIHQSMVKYTALMRKQIVSVQQMKRRLNLFFHQLLWCNIIIPVELRRRFINSNPTILEVLTKAISG
ncbi:hypothetical protein LJ707_13320 [Mucilaginibacter sp. UR6-1]|uniref:hypothetical protein n=1 Tax=Mucilaginibacter sp. UR6-1 TaxID=1435643 RepID=UPI001E429078|nr:hypothetical protein [Mucilaginibacter sp. UR6-1]MCC8409912.1 hypothetical protein [Mucilaginibacter sp. UR6-1]